MYRLAKSDSCARVDCEFACVCKCVSVVCVVFWVCLRGLRKKKGNQERKSRWVAGEIDLVVGDLHTDRQSSKSQRKKMPLGRQRPLLRGCRVSLIRSSGGGGGG